MKDHHWKGWLLVGSAVAGLVLASGCSTQTKRQWLTFFFDGVPPEKSSQSVVTTNAVAGGTNVATSPSASSAPELIQHPPYAEGKCTECHESRFSQKMRGNPGELCFGCHKNFLVPGNSWHAPAAAGECVLCHEPHQSSRKSLLKEAPNGLCVQCHAAGEIAALAAHQKQAAGDCATCHDPHQSRNRFLLKPKAAPTGDVTPNPPQPAGTAAAVVPPAAQLPPAGPNPAAPALARTNDVPVVIPNQSRP
jgi:predicted CXXCH cytochrome family protein